MTVLAAVFFSRIGIGGEGVKSCQLMRRYYVTVLLM